LFGLIRVLRLREECVKEAETDEAREARTNRKREEERERDRGKGRE